MKVILTICVLTVAAVSLAEDTYNAKYDNFDVKELTENKRLLTSYAHCFLDQGRCTPEGKEVKGVIPEAVVTRCGKCTPKQKELVRIVAKAIQQQLPEEWQKLVEKHDPKGKYGESFDEFIAGN